MVYYGGKIREEKELSGTPVSNAEAIAQLQRKVSDLSKRCCCGDFGITALNPPVTPPTGNDPTVLFNPTEGIWFYWDGDSWEISSSGAAGAGITEVTYAQASTLVGAGGLTPGASYKITDRGDLGIFLTALTSSTFKKEGTRIMAVPRTYRTTALSGFNWLGVWDPGLVPSIGDLVIWGGHVWANNSGTNAASYDTFVALNPSEWDIVPKLPFTDQQYMAQVFEVTYDFTNDWIEEQRDGRGNVVGIAYELAVYNLITNNNPVDHTDWNMSTIFNGGKYLEFYHNVSPFGIYNNIVVDKFQHNRTAPSSAHSGLAGIIGNTAASIQNNMAGYITKNYALNELSNNIVYAGGIYNNYTTNLYNNTASFISDNITGFQINFNEAPDGIFNNTNASNIIGNYVQKEISFNTCVGAILRNVGMLSIKTNSNNGVIQDNSNTGNIESNDSNVTDISFNRNRGDILSNTFNGSILRNSNNGDITGNNTTNSDITDNANNGAISYNSLDAKIIFMNINNGEISGNTGIGEISYNSNNGNIINNNTKSIERNNNSGDISGNSNNGGIVNNRNRGAINSNSCSDITNNINNGDISTNAHDGEISDNMNNGRIISCSGSGGFGVYHNTNNGEINNPAGLAAADVTDPTVNK